MTRYSEEFKYTIIKRMMPPQNESVSAISRETGNTKRLLKPERRTSTRPFKEGRRHLGPQHAPPGVRQLTEVSDIDFEAP
ncbi:hypothetical protein [Desulfotruncus alcoholivorax]|uniref:hypothetical protein n=1 Tax=Desulfotruncus alcoholivorax TaxID=265477 RepID=UPI0004874AB1|nr:hypothetical protein [Desulfotruncus alcoholivorax]